MIKRFDLFQASQFKTKALELFRYQAAENEVYKQFVDFLGVEPAKIRELKDIPFLPIEFFKSREVITGKMKAEMTFSSSGTTGSVVSKHHVVDLDIYRKSFMAAFHLFYGNVKDWVILALLPNYLERSGSSLVYMASELIDSSDHEESGFYLDELDLLAEKLEFLDSKGNKVLLLGVSFALLDLVESRNFSLQNTVVMETGGMKGRRKEMVREELHAELCRGFGVKKIHSEYGMTELLSQAYSSGEGIFECPPWMKILIRDAEDPLSILPENRGGGINVIDLANIYSCSFIATQDLGKVISGGRFQVLGRFDNADIRGCNLLVV